MRFCLYNDIAKFPNQSVLGTVWLRDSGEYRALTYQAYNYGKSYLKEIVKDPKNKDKKLAVVLDFMDTPFISCHICMSGSPSKES